MCQKFAKEKEKERKAAEEAAKNPPPPTLQQRLTQAKAISGVGGTELERLAVEYPSSGLGGGSNSNPRALAGACSASSLHLYDHFAITHWQYHCFKLSHVQLEFVSTRFLLAHHRSASGST